MFTAKIPMRHIVIVTHFFWFLSQFWSEDLWKRYGFYPKCSTFNLLASLFVHVDAPHYLSNLILTLVLYSILNNQINEWDLAILFYSSYATSYVITSQLPFSTSTRVCGISHGLAVWLAIVFFGFSKSSGIIMLFLEFWSVQKKRCTWATHFPGYGIGILFLLITQLHLKFQISLDIDYLLLGLGFPSLLMFYFNIKLQLFKLKYRRIQSINELIKNVNGCRYSP